MKKKNLKLSFKKETISKLQMNHANGGAHMETLLQCLMTLGCPATRECEEPPVDYSNIPAACTVNTCAP